MMTFTTQDLLPLPDVLAAPDAPTDGWRGQWRFARVEGGQNNVVYRATADQGDLAIKFTARDARDRAGREYAALSALQHEDVSLAPYPVLLEKERFPLLVVVQTWLDGEVVLHPPQTDVEWRGLLDHYAAIHRLTPARTHVRLAPAVLALDSVAACRRRLGEGVKMIPTENWPAALMDLVRRVEQTEFPYWPTPSLALCRCDPNTRNFIRRPERWASVDWENSGWGDPAFELADLMAHPTYIVVPPQRWAWVIDVYHANHDDRTIGDRVRAYYTLTLAWWAARFARMSYESTRGLERRRLVERSSLQRSDVETRYTHYLDAARAALVSSG